MRESKIDLDRAPNFQRRPGQHDPVSRSHRFHGRHSESDDSDMLRFVEHQHFKFDVVYARVTPDERMHCHHQVRLTSFVKERMTLQAMQRARANRE